MKHHEYIVPIGDEAEDYDEMFIGVIRRHPVLIRCRDCKWYEARIKRCNNSKSTEWKPDDYCSDAERKEE